MTTKGRRRRREAFADCSTRVLTPNNAHRQPGSSPPTFASLPRLQLDPPPPQTISASSLKHLHRLHHHSIIPRRQATPYVLPSIAQVSDTESFDVGAESNGPWIALVVDAWRFPLVVWHRVILILSCLFRVIPACIRTRRYQYINM